MVIALVFLTLVICLIIDYVRTRGAEVRAAVGSVPDAAPCATRILERYYHPGHSWAMMDEPAFVTVGIDDLAQRFMGAVDRVEIPDVGSAVRQGEPLVTLRRGSRALTLVAPVSGSLTETNKKLSSDPSILKGSPYEKGWVAKIAPSNLAVELRNLLKGQLADRWREGVQAQILAWFSPRLGIVLQDGGHLIEDLSKLVNEEEWNELARSLFLIQPSDNSQINS